MSSGDKEQVISGDSSNNGGSRSVLVILVVIALVVGTIAVILGIVALSNRNIKVNDGDVNGGARDGDDDDDDGDGDGDRTSGGNDGKIWQLSFEHTGNNYGYIDDATGELKGFQVDLTTAVCQIAGKNCELVYDSPTRCWDSQPGARPQGGEGLMNQYYDACVGWVHSYDRPRTFKFSKPYSFPIKTVFIVKDSNSDFVWNNIKSTDKIGFIDGWAYDEHCIAREKDNIQGWDLAESQIMRYAGRDELLEGLQNDEVDAIFDNTKGWIAKTASTIGVKTVGDEIASCAKDGLSVMMRKDNQLDAWWNPAFETLKNSEAQWRGICNDLLDEHGHRGGPTPQEFCVDYPSN